MRVVTRPDFDGLVCGALISLIEEIDSYLFVEPKSMQDGLVEILQGDIIANLPYHPNCSLWFDHHITNKVPGFEFPIVLGKGGYRLAPSAARVVYEYYITVTGKRRETEGRRKQSEGNRRIQEGLRKLNSERIRVLLEETDRIDAGILTPEDVLHPQGYVLISMTIFNKRHDDEPYWLRLITLLSDSSVEEILADEDVRQRCQQIFNAQDNLREVLLKRATLKSNVIFIDLRGTQDITDINRFLVYTLFPQGNISLKVTYDTEKPNATAISVGHNIFNRSGFNVGPLMAKYGGGGHAVVGSCRVPNEQAEKVIQEILETIKE